MLRIKVSEEKRESAGSVNAKESSWNTGWNSKVESWLRRGACEADETLNQWKWDHGLSQTTSWKKYEIEGGGETSPARRVGIIPRTTATNASCISEAEWKTRQCFTGAFTRATAAKSNTSCAPTKPCL